MTLTKAASWSVCMPGLRRPRRRGAERTTRSDARLASAQRQAPQRGARDLSKLPLRAEPACGGGQGWRRRGPRRRGRRRPKAVIVEAALFGRLAEAAADVVVAEGGPSCTSSSPRSARSGSACPRPGPSPRLGLEGGGLVRRPEATALMASTSTSTRSRDEALVETRTMESPRRARPRRRGARSRTPRRGSGGSHSRPGHKVPGPGLERAPAIRSGRSGSRRGTDAPARAARPALGLQRPRRQGPAPLPPRGRHREERRRRARHETGPRVGPSSPEQPRPPGPVSMPPRKTGLPP